MSNAIENIYDQDDGAYPTMSWLLTPVRDNGLVSVSNMYDERPTKQHYRKIHLAHK